METRGSDKTGETDRCESETEEVQGREPQDLSGDLAAGRSPRQVAAQKHLARLDEVRRVARLDRAKLFLRAAVSIDYLVLLSQAGVLVARGVAQTNCAVINGELKCVHNGEPRMDCRQPWCRYGALMRMRLVNRLSEAYALERKKLGVAS